MPWGLDKALMNSFFCILSFGSSVPSSRNPPRIYYFIITKSRLLLIDLLPYLTNFYLIWKFGLSFQSNGEVKLGELSAYVRDRRVPLELCPSSNVQTGAAKSIKDHPIGVLTKLGFRATVNTDNRLMSDTSMTKEMTLLVNELGFTLKQLQWLTVNAMKSSFIPFDQRLKLINETIKPTYAKIAQDLGIKF